ncbi:phage integrase family protein [Hydrogenophaga sp.]|uniref:phage integrase family protein n=1 Tax=Hydrogenophaga sp. TaxID=1904254 RepID=UPI0027279AB9|nr:phage integrase family protein [Hydrogenophaga sp.]MDO9134119.1 phage integrase family protein [Hydrogenophaga sp.]
MQDEPTQETFEALPAVAEPVVLAAPASKRGRGRPRKTTDAPLPLEKVKLPRGRQAGYRVPTFADLDELTVEDFSFVRGVVNGMSPHEAYARFYGNIHFDSQGAPLVPHGATLKATFDQLEQRILATAQASEDKRLQLAAAVISQTIPAEGAEADKRDINEIYEAWFDSLPAADYYGEAELPERFQEYLEDNGIEIRAALSSEVSRAVIIDRKVKAINELQTILAYRPRPDADTSIWLAGTLASTLAQMQITTLRQLVKFIGATGRNWHRKVPRLGPIRAARLQAWLSEHADTVGRIQTTGPAWTPYVPLKSALVPLKRAGGTVVDLMPEPGGALALPASQRPGWDIAPLELLQVPARLDGQEGLFRVRGPNLYEAKTDLDAITVWLRSFLVAEKKRTFEAYRREAERFLIWCYSVAHVAVSSVSIGHAQAYQAFLKNIPAECIGDDRVTRDDPRWKPWRGQLSPKSQTYSLTVIKLMYQALMKHAYLTGNPFSSLKSEAVMDRTMDTSRSLNTGDVEWLNKLMERRKQSAKNGASAQNAIEGAEAPCPTLMQARTRRLDLLLELLVRTGMRLEEVATSDASRISTAEVDGHPAPGHFVMEVVGKGKKVRTIYLPAKVKELIDLHHHDVEQLIEKAEGPHSPRLVAFRSERPLIATLTGFATNTSMAPANTEKRAFALGKHGIYKTLKYFLRTAAKRDLTALQREHAKVKLALTSATKQGDVKEVARLQVEVRRVAEDAKVALRRMTFSTHWMRHTFAKEVIRRNPGSDGLNQAKNALGHASIATTGAYLRQDVSSLVKAMAKVNPLGT